MKNNRFLQFIALFIYHSRWKSIAYFWYVTTELVNLTIFWVVTNTSIKVNKRHRKVSVYGFWRLLFVLQSVLIFRRLEKSHTDKISILFDGGIAVANVLDYNIIVSEFELQPRYHVHFQTNTLRKGMNSVIPTCYGLDSTTSVIPLGFFRH